MGDDRTAGSAGRGAPAREPYRASFDPDSESASDAVDAAVSAVRDGPDDEGPGIDSVFDPIVLDALVRRRRGTFRLTFDYDDHVVSVRSDGEVSVWTGTGSSDPSYTYRVGPDESPSDAVIRAVSDVRGTDPSSSSEPLYSFVGPDALDAILEGTRGAEDRRVRVSFEVDELRVVVSDDGRVVVHPPQIV
ncbi:HalOD1 output domain-containing protein [Halobaculum sp. EA56]|uniref:HalOD1 output domain-containing protein n=1 Tax=Halobaculum sp. EA56 TaxID=3421648 RepID=UPI003EB732E5